MRMGLERARVPLVLLLVPKLRENENVLVFACLALFAGIWIEKGLGMVITGFIPDPLGNVPTYMPSLNELLVSLGVYSIGALILSVLYKVAVTVRKREPEAAWAEEVTKPLATVASAGD